MTPLYLGSKCMNMKCMSMKIICKQTILFYLNILNTFYNLSVP